MSINIGLIDDEKTPIALIEDEKTPNTPIIYKPGDKIGGQYIVQYSASGGMGVVYFCRDMETNHPYALKTIQSDYWTNPKHNKLFEQEIRTWIALEKHPNIVRCYYLGIFDNLPFMVLEWVADPNRKNVDLYKWLEQHGPLELRMALNIAIDVCYGLIHAQQKQEGFVHLDLKPSNILLTADHTAKITDFGIATLSQSNQSAVSPGTPGYAAPEQRHGGLVDGRADIYALGCLLYEMLTGQRLFKNAFNSQEQINKLEAWHMTHDTIPVTLKVVVQSCLQEKRTQRLEQVKILLDQLQQIYQQKFGEPHTEAIGEDFKYRDYHNRGLTYYRLNDFEMAIIDYNKVISLNANYGLAYSNRGIAYAKTGNYDQAMADYNKAILLNPKLDSAYINRGITYAEKKDYEQAIANYNVAVQLDPRESLAYINRGNAHADLGDYDQAIADFNEAIRLDPKNDDAYNNRGTVYAQKKEYDQAIADYNRAIQLNPKLSVAYDHRGRVYAAIGNYDRAIIDYNEAIQIDPKLGSAYNNRGQAYVEKGDYDQAITDYNKAIQLDSKDDAAYNNRGKAYTLKGHYDQAIADYTETIQLDPKDDAAYNNRGIAYMNKGDYSQAMADYYEAVKINPDNFNARCNLTLLFEMTELNRAIANCNEVIRLNPSLASAYYDRAKVYAKNADTEKAIVDYSESIRCDPNFTLAYFARADLYESNNEFHKALLDYRYIIEIAPDNKEAHNKLDILLHTIHLNEAIADYNESVQINHLGEVVQLNPKLALAYSNRGDVYASQGIFDHAIADYACAIWFNPQIVSFYYNRSSIFTRTEHYNQIINDFKNNLEIEPHESDTHREFGIYLMALGEIEEGKKYFRQAIELNPSLADELAQYLDDEA